MTLGRTLWILMGSVVAGLIFGVAFSGGDLVSVGVWVGASAVGITAVVLRDLLVASSMESMTIKPAWEFTPEHGPRLEPHRVRNLTTLVTSAQSNPRMYSRRLKPHLLDMANHFLPRRHGLDMESDRVEVAVLLDDVHWMIDPSIDDRVPKMEELERFLTIVLGDNAMPESRTFSDRDPT